MEADLARWYHLDYRDRWRGGLSLRRIMVLLSNLPADSACAQVGRGSKPHWSLEAHLLDDLRVALTGSKQKPSKRHPMRPSPKRRVKQTPERRRKLDAARKRARERRRQIEAGEL